MGWAKYSEDNLEFFYERMEVMNFRKQEEHNSFVNTISTEKKVAETDSDVSAVSVRRAYRDKYIHCRDCGEKFLFSAQKQKQYEKKDWSEPKRCKVCREFRKILYLMRASL